MHSIIFLHLNTYLQKSAKTIEKELDFSRRHGLYIMFRVSVSASLNLQCQLSLVRFSI